MSKKAEPTEEELIAARSLLARANGKKGGKSWWNALSKEAKEKRIADMVKSRKEIRASRS